MSEIINLMSELDLCDKTITQTVSKITLICATRDFPLHQTSTTYKMCGNGNGNGNN